MDLTDVYVDNFVEWDNVEGEVVSFFGRFYLRGKSCPYNIISSPTQDFRDIYGPSRMISSSISDPDPGYIVPVTGME